MANICTERVVIVARQPSDMAEVLYKMGETVIAGSWKEKCFSRKELDSAKDDTDALYELLKRLTQNNAHLLCLFATEPDTRAESGWMGWRVDTVAKHPVIEIEIGLKWGASMDPGRFCSELDPTCFGFSISDSGEAYDWEMIHIDDEYLSIECDDIPAMIEKSRSAKNRARSLSKIAYHVNLAGIEPSFYGGEEEF